jgi:hypothetical protein
VGDEDYDERYVSHYNIVLIDEGAQEGEYAMQDQTVTDALGKVWHIDDVDEQVVFLTEGIHASAYFAIDRTWVCSGSNKRLSEEDASITVNGGIFDDTWASANLQVTLIPEDLSQAMPVDGLMTVRDPMDEATCKSNAHAGEVDHV